MDKLEHSYCLKMLDNVDEDEHYDEDEYYDEDIYYDEDEELVEEDIEDDYYEDF